MKKPEMFLVVLIAFAIATFGFVSGNVYAVGDAELNGIIEEYHETIEKYADALLSGKWGTAKKTAQSLLKQSGEINSIGEKEKNRAWLNESSLLITFSKELIKAADEKEKDESFFIAAGLYMHFQLFKASNPKWLVNYINDQVKELSEAIEKKDKDEAIKIAEKVNIGTSATAISGAIMKRYFANTRWIQDANEMSIAADEIQEPLHKENWSEAEEMLKEIGKTNKKIKNSLKK